MPLHLAGGRIQRHNRRPVAVRPFSRRAVKVNIGRPQRDENQAAFHIYGADAPGVHPGALRRLLGLPFVLLDGVEAPHKLAGLHVPGPQVPRDAHHGLLACARARNHQVPEDGGRRRDAVLLFGVLLGEVRLEIDDSFIPKTRDQLAGFGIEREQHAVLRAVNNLRRQILCSGPEVDTAERRSMFALKGPDTLARLGVHSNHAVVGCGQIHYAIHHQRHRLRPSNPGASRRAATATPAIGVIHRLRLRFRNVITPRELQLLHVSRRDLRQRRIPLIAPIMTPRGPIRLRR